MHRGELENLQKLEIRYVDDLISQLEDIWGTSAIYRTT